MAKSWKCANCGKVNTPDDPKFSPTECANCGATKSAFYRSRTFYISAGGAIFLILVIILISTLVGLPEKRYKEAYKKAIMDGQISLEEQKELDKIARLIPLKKRKKWEEEVKGVVVATPSTQTRVSTASTQPPTIISPQRGETKAEPSLEAKQHMQAGMMYASLAQKNPATASENYENARTEFTNAINLYSKYAEAYSNRGVVYMQQKKFNFALEDLKKAAELKSNDPIIHYDLAALYSRQNQLDLGLSELDKALEYNFSNYDALRSDPDLNNLRRQPEFRRTLERHRVFIFR